MLGRGHAHCGHDVARVIADRCADTANVQMIFFVIERITALANLRELCDERFDTHERVRCACSEATAL